MFRFPPSDDIISCELLFLFQSVTDRMGIRYYFLLDVVSTYLELVYIIAMCVKLFR